MGLIIVAVFLIIGGTYFYNVEHEGAHRLIAERSGGEGCMSSVSLFGGGYTFCEDYGNKELHLWNEIIGYNLYGMAIIIFLGLVLIAFVLFNKEVEVKGS